MTQPPAQMPEDHQYYSEAMRMLQYEGNSIWQRFNAFMVAHGLLAGFLAHYALEVSRSQGSLFVLLLAVVLGLVVSLMWWSAFERSSAFFDLRIQQAKRFEPSSLGILREGGQLSEKGYCDFEASAVVSEALRMRYVGRPPLRVGPRIIIASFSMFYYVLGGYGMYARLGSWSHWAYWERATFCSVGAILVGSVLTLSRKTKKPNSSTQQNTIPGPGAQQTDTKLAPAIEPEES